MYNSHKKVHCYAFKLLWALVIIGAINWGLVGVFNFDVVREVFHSIVWLQDVLYIIIGLAGIVLLFGGCRCMTCTPSDSTNCCGRGCGKSKSEHASHK